MERSPALSRRSRIPAAKATAAPTPDLTAPVPPEEDRAAAPAAPKARRGIQSIEVGMAVLQGLAAASQPLPLRDIAAATGMPAAKVHPYLVSFMVSGLVRQRPDSSLYELGPMALQLGLAALRQLDPIKEATGDVEELVSRWELTITLTIWGNLGPTVVRMAEPRYPAHVNLRVGAVMSILNTVTGRLFASYLPASRVDAMLEQEHRHIVGGPATPTMRAQLTPELERIRAHGIAAGQGVALPGVSVLSVPIFQADGQMVMALTAIGHEGLFAADIHGPVAQDLLHRSASISHRLGWPGSETGAEAAPTPKKRASSARVSSQ